MATLPHAFHVGPAAVADAVAQRPHAREAIELAARRRNACGNRVRIVGDIHGSRDAARGEHVGQLIAQPHALDLPQIRRILYDAVSEPLPEQPRR